MASSWIKKLMFWSKPKKQAGSQKETSYDPQLLSMDFYSQLVYMTAIATSGIARDKLIYYAAKLPFVAARFPQSRFRRENVQP
jgi:hypothetical protein